MIGVQNDLLVMAARSVGSPLEVCDKLGRCRTARLRYVRGQDRREGPDDRGERLDDGGAWVMKDRRERREEDGRDRWEEERSSSYGSWWRPCR